MVPSSLPSLLSTSRPASLRSLRSSASSVATLISAFAALVEADMRLDASGWAAGVGVSGLAAAVVVWFLVSRTSFGVRLQVLGASTRSARHMGLDVPRLIVVGFLLSGMFVGFAAAVEILGVKGYVRADSNPAFGLWVVPLVFLARLHPIGVIPYVAALSLVSIGGDYAAQNAGLTSKFTLLLVGLTLIFMALTEWIARRGS